MQGRSEAGSVGRLVRVVVATLAMLPLAGTAVAGPITFNLGGNGGVGSVGNQRTYTSGGLTVYATAWASSNGTNLSSAALAQYSPGVGVCDSGEIGNCSSPAHTVDNLGYTNYVLFLFSAPVDPTSVSVIAYGDTDVSYWMGNVAGAANQLNLLTGQTFASLAALGFGARQDDAGGSANRTVTLNSPFNSYNALLFGTSTTSTDDAFKISQLIVDTASPNPGSPVPEPTTVVLLGTGILAVMARRYFAKR
jgi:PEP-CTERM motif